MGAKRCMQFGVSVQLGITSERASSMDASQKAIENSALNRFFPNLFFQNLF